MKRKPMKRNYYISDDGILEDEDFKARLPFLCLG
jgi:hypothetical protein